MKTQPSVNQQGCVKPKLVRIIARLNVGGPARQVCLLHQRLVPYFDCRLIIGELAEGEQDMGYLLSSERGVIRLPMMSREIRPWSDAKAFWTILRVLHKERPAVVHTHTAKAGALGRIAAYLVGVPVIVHTYHGHVFQAYFSSWRTRLYVAIERLLGRLTTCVVAISESQTEDVCGKYRIIPREKTCLVHNGFDLARFSDGSVTEARKRLGLQSDDFVVAWVGRMAPVKDVGLLDDVIRKADQKGKRICFLIVGDGSDRSKLTCLSQANANVRWLGWRRDVEAIWKAADVALLTSLNEGTPTALIESMAAGIPFVAANVGGVQDLAIGERHALPENMGFRANNGFLVSRTPQAFLYCLQQLQQNPELKEQMGAAGKAFVCRQFSMQRLNAELHSLYCRLMQKTRGTAVALDQPIEEDSSKIADAL